MAFADKVLSSSPVRVTLLISVKGNMTLASCWYCNWKTHKPILKTWSQALRSCTYFLLYWRLSLVMWLTAVGRGDEYGDHRSSLRETWVMQRTRFSHNHFSSRLHHRKILSFLFLGQRTHVFLNEGIPAPPPPPFLFCLQENQHDILSNQKRYGRLCVLLLFVFVYQLIPP